MGSFRGAVGRAQQTLHRRDGPVDAGVALVVSIFGLIVLARPTDPALLPVAVALALLTTSPVAWRNRSPLTAVVVTASATVGYQWVTGAKTFPPAAVLALLFLLYTAGVRGVSRRHYIELAVLAVLTIGMCIAVVAASGSLTGSTVATDAPPLLAALAAGYLVARQRSLTHQLTATIAQLRSDEELRVAAAAAKERNRLARELHDVVAHGVSAIVVQAGVARITVAAEPDLALAALAEIVTAGRLATEELHQIVGTLGPDSRSAPFGLAGIRSLVERRRAAGLPVQLTISGDDPVLSDPVDVACYRLVQEALTNVVKHAPAAATTVELVVDDSVIDVSVRNAAPPGRRVSPPSPASGHGLNGMTERVASCAGQLSYGPQPEGGFEVRARLPVDNRTASSVRRPSSFLERFRVLSPRLAVLVAMAILCSDAVLSSSRRAPLAGNLALCAGMAATLLWRRRFPLLFLVAVNTLAFPISNGLTSINNATLASTYVFAIPIWTVAAWSKARTAMVGLLVAIGFEAAEGLHWHLSTGSVGANAVICVALWGAGRMLRAQRQVSADLADARTRLELSQRARQQLTLAAARTGMVAELDTLIVDQVEAMVADAESAGRMIETGGGSVREAIGRIEDDGRNALTRLRDILGLLRAEHDPQRLSPLLGVDQFDVLVSRHSGSGRPTRFEVTGPPATLLGGTDLVVYRVIDSVLTGAGCHTVNLHFDDDGPLRLRFCLVEARSAWPDPASREDIDRVGGHIEQTAQEIIVQLPIAAT